MGLKILSERDQVAVRIGNQLMAFSASLTMAARYMRIPCDLENPQEPPFLGSSNLPANHLYSVSVAIFDFCRFGRRWQKRTRSVGFHIDLAPLDTRCQQRRGICPSTGIPHIRLVGTKDGKFLTAIA